MKIKNKILFVLCLFFLLFIFNTDTVKAVDVTIKDLDSSENVNGSHFMQGILNSEEYKSGNYYTLAYNEGNNSNYGDVYFISKDLDFQIYFDYNFSTYYRFAFSPTTQVIHYTLRYDVDNALYRGETINLATTVSFNINAPLYFYSDIDIYTDNTFTDYFYEANKFEPVFENLYFVETLEGYFLQTDKLNYDNYIDYDMYLYDEDNNIWSKEAVTKEFVSDNYYDENGLLIYTTAIQFKYEVLDTGVFTFRLQHNSADITSNSYTYTVTDFNVADRLIYDISEPYFTYDYDNGNAIVYTNYLDVKYYDIVSLYYYNENDEYDNWSLFSSSIMSKEYNKDKTQFRFKLKFSEPVSYTCRYIVSGEYGLYYSEIGSFSISQEFFDNNGYEEQGLLSRISDFFKGLFSSVFVPKEESFLQLTSVFKEKFAFVDSIKIGIDSISNIISNDITTQKHLSYEVDTPIYQGELVIDFNWFDKFKPYTDLFLTGFVYLGFVWRLYKRLPSIISGLV